MPIPKTPSESNPANSKNGSPSLALLIAFLPARTLLILLGQSVFAMFYRLTGNASPWSSAGAWWTVWGTIADVGCLLVLSILTRRENLRIRDLVGIVNRRVPLTGLRYFFIIFPASVLGNLIASWALYGSWQAPMPVGVVIGRHLPLWGILYSIFLWSPIWTTTEELTYNGYLLPRVAAFSANRRIPVLVVGFWWVAQHCLLPLVLGWKFILWRFLSFIPGVLCLILVYQRSQRLAPVIFAHWLMDLIAAVTTLSFK
jgi:membrane protease YdiL (CAAX protease family)